MASTISSVLVREGSWSTVTRAEANFTDTSVTPFSFPTRFSILATQEGQLKPSARKMLRVVAGVVVIVMPFFDLWRSEEHTSELQSRGHLVCRLLLEKKKKQLLKQDYTHKT